MSVEPLTDSHDLRLDAERFALECARRGVPAEYWPAALAAAEELLNREDDDE